jgi:hypothetical protein
MCSFFIINVIVVVINTTILFTTSFYFSFWCLFKTTYFGISLWLPEIFHWFSRSRYSFFGPSGKIPWANLAFLLLPFFLCDYVVWQFLIYAGCHFL